MFRRNYGWEYKRITIWRSHVYGKRLPAVGRAGLDGVEIALNDALIAERTQLLHLGLSDAPAGSGELLKFSFARKLLIEGDEFAQFVAAGMAMSGFDRG